MKRREFPTKVKLAAFQRAAGHCEKCTTLLAVGKFHYDHRIADAMGGEPAIENCEVLCVACHAEKTAVDIGHIAKSRRQRAKHIGAKKPKSFRKPAGVEYDWKRGRYIRRSPQSERAR